jgi:hypothetical protein
MPPHNLNNRLSLAQNLMIPKSQDRESVPLQPAIASSVMGVGKMLSAVDLDDQPGFEADEVGDKATDRRLAAELETQLPMPQMTPQAALGLGHVPAQFPCAGCRP